MSDGSEQNVACDRYGSKEAEAESYIECMQVTPAGAVFYQSGNLLKLTDEEIEREVREEQ